MPEKCPLLNKLTRSLIYLCVHTSQLYVTMTNAELGWSQIALSIDCAADTDPVQACGQLSLGLYEQISEPKLNQFPILLVTHRQPVLINFKVVGVVLCVTSLLKVN